MSTHDLITDTDPDIDNFVIVSSGVYIVKYIFKKLEQPEAQIEQ